jgi:uncharacterized protein with PQ loop repeat
MFSVVLGYIAMIFLMLAGIPQAYKIYKQGHAKGVSTYYLVMVLLGFITMICYVFITNKSIPLIVNYAINIISFSIMAWYKVYPREVL